MSGKSVAPLSGHIQINIPRILKKGQRKCDSLQSRRCFSRAYSSVATFAEMFDERTKKWL